MAFKNLHPTVIARIVNQRLFHSSHPDQLYWRVDENTLMARFYLIMQLCIKPERYVRTINGFFDYAVIPEMCPSNDGIEWRGQSYHAGTTSTGEHSGSHQFHRR